MKRKKPDGLACLLLRVTGVMVKEMAQDGFLL